MRLKLFAAASVIALISTPALAREEGMWTYDNFPIARVNQTYGSTIDQAWLNRVQLASIRLSTGCSASIVSAEGLVLTNNHCVEACVQNLSTADNQYALTGFLPATREEERRCQGMQAEILTGIEDVTDRVRAAGEGLEGRAFTQARDAMMGQIETEACADRPDMRCQVVSLYRGGQFKLYTYRKYEDVRLAFAPEEAAGSFGGDLDNFNFPRFGLDAAFLRLYENGQPMNTPGHLGWDAGPPEAGELVVVSGSPGSTQRLLTMSQLQTVRDIVLPLDQMTRSELRGRLLRFASESDENAFIASSTLSSIENSYKRGRGQGRALIDAEFMAGRAEDEADLRRRVGANLMLAERIGDPWGEIDALQDDYAELYPAYFFLESRAGGGSQLYAWARTLVRAARERERPASERLPEYGDSRLGLLRAQTLAENPTYPELNEIQLEWWLSKTREILTVDDPRIRPLLGNENPEGLAARLIAGTTLADAAARQALWDGGLAAVEASDDPLIQFVLATETLGREARAEWEERVEGPTDRAAERLAEARFAVYGDSIYPDATRTPRLTFGRVEGWTYDGRTVEPFTTFGGLFARATGAAPFEIAPRWQGARDRLDMDTRFNMAVSTDTIGGNSGSPAINADGEVIGANFDSTFLGQRNAFGYDPAVNRSVIVTAQAITAALRDVYGMGRLADELGVD
ncbi:S46 family peptidase [Brevundimonas aveniformis]|uniref:S46 family peptidase n=1 Tax=Brevundimonas aveniformis TaxID=370977 RepID=UPI000414D277|nr:S46 family peptidase [Brevundimonas aveniformis]